MNSPLFKSIQPFQCLFAGAEHFARIDLLEEKLVDRYLYLAQRRFYDDRFRFDLRAPSAVLQGDLLAGFKLRPGVQSQDYKLPEPFPPGEIIVDLRITDGVFNRERCVA